MPVISEEAWESGVGAEGDAAEAILAAFGKQKDLKLGMDMDEIKKVTGLKWIFGPVKKLVEAGKLERKKFGKKYGYRLTAEGVEDIQTKEE